MDNQWIKIYAPRSKTIVLRVMKGHYTTCHSHVNMYIDLTTMKTRLREASDAARVIAKQYSISTIVDTIVCLDGCEVIGAQLAHELTRIGVPTMNTHNTIYIITPEFNTNGQMIFRDNIQPAIVGKHILLLVASATTGDTIRRSLDCIEYYGGIVDGINAIFSAVDEIDGANIHSIFKAKDLPDYYSYKISECPLCKNNQKLDAIIDSSGYIKL